jgi:quercetin dioxygenase-like cupin family protein
MKIISPKNRIMREEFLAKGMAIDTGEIRKTYDLQTLRTNLTFIPENEIQRPHSHILASEAVHVLAGEIQISHEGRWRKIVENQIALFDSNEIHNIRTTKPSQPILYPKARENTAAVAMVYKWIAPYFKIFRGEISFVIENDWFDERYENSSSDPSTSPVLRLKKSHQRKFWQILSRNKISNKNF